MLTDSFYLLEAPITLSLEIVPDFQTSAYRRKYYQLFKQNVFSAHIKKNYTLLNIIWVNTWNQRRNLQDLGGQNHCKNVGLFCTVMQHLALISMDYNCYIFFFFHRLLSEK